MKKGGVVSKLDESPAKRSRRNSGGTRRSGVDSPLGGGAGIGSMGSSGTPWQWRGAPRVPALGGANRDWEFPDIETTDIHIAPSWAAAADATDANIENQSGGSESQQQQQQQQQHQQQQPTTSAQGSTSHYHTVYPQNDPRGTGEGSGNVSSSATVVTTSTAGSSNTSSIRNITSSSATALPTPIAGISNTNYSRSMSSSATVVTQSTAGATHPLVQQPAALFQPSPHSAPKAALYTFYGKKPRRKQLANEDYLTWNNGGRPHELRFTTIFQCPLTGELFPSGRFGDPKCYIAEKMMNRDGKYVEVIWYTKKTLAEHGAAAKCLDCLLYREAIHEGGGLQANRNMVRLSADPPYLANDSPRMPPVPPDVAEKIEETKQRIRQGAPVHNMMP